MKNSRFSSFVGWGNSISNRFVFVGKLELLTKFVGALLFVVALGGNAMGQTYTAEDGNPGWGGFDFTPGKINCVGANMAWRTITIKKDGVNYKYEMDNGYLRCQSWENNFTVISADAFCFKITDDGKIEIVEDDPAIEDDPTEDPSGDEPVEEIYTLVWRNNNDVKSESIDCYQTLVAKAYGGYSGFLIKASDGHYLTHSEYNSKGLKTENCKEVGEWMSLDDGVNREYAKIMLNSQNGSSEKTYYFGLKGLKITMYESAPNCGIEVPDIYFGNSTVCKESTISDLLNLSGAKSEGWEYTDGSEVDFTNLIIGKSIQYFAVDDKNVKSTSNTVKIIDKPSISDIDPIVFCSDDGEYNLQNLLDKVQNNEGSNPSTAITFNGSSVSGNYTFSNAGTLKITSTNGCSNGTPTTKDIPVTIGCTPHITLSNSDNIETCNGNSIVLPNVTVDDGSTAQWKIKKSGSSTWTNFSASTVLDMSYNGATLRAEATNAQGTGKSTEITLIVNSDAPGFTYTKSPNQTTLSQTLGGTPASVTYTLKKNNECNSDPISISIVNEDDFEVDPITNTVRLKSGKGVGTYTTTVTFTQAGETKTEDITVSVVEWPKCYNVIDSDGEIIEICTDENGDLIIDLDASPFKDFKGTLTIPSDLEIVCNNFKIYGGKDNYEFKLINSGLIHCESDCSIGIEDKTLGSSTIDGNAIFVNGSTGSIIANNIDVRYRYAMPNFEGSWISTKNINILNGQGQDLHFLDDCTIQANELKIQCNISNAVIIEGDLIVDNIESSKKIYVESDGELTVGDITKIPWAASVIIKENGTLNLCSNPTLNSADDLGFIIGTVLYNIAAWPDTNPFEEQDINKSDGSESWMWNSLGGNSDWSPKSLIGAYKNYEDCMLKKADPSFLGIDDDPFLPKQKEIKHLYNYNPCDDETLYKFQYGQEIYRIFEQHFIRCEKDNKRKK